MRTHARLSVAWSNTDTSPICHYGSIVEDGANWSGTPFNDTQLPWLHLNVLEPGTARNSIAVGTSILAGDDLDIRARRRIPDLNDSYLWKLYNGGSASLTYTLFIRTLVMLH
jgi:hypothetical protein